MTSKNQTPVSQQRPNARQQLRESELPDAKLRRSLNDKLTNIQRDAVDPLSLRGVVLEYNLANWTSSGYNYPDVRVPFVPRAIVCGFDEQENSPTAAPTAAPYLRWKPKTGGAQVTAVLGLPTTGKSYHLRLLVLK